REDDDISTNVKEILEKKGISFILNSSVKSFKDINEEVEVSYLELNDNSEKTIKGDAVLLATGRKPNIDGLNLENAGVKVT
ncbi:Pyridine nucleotide-disulfide oxidoreductase family protein, partial [human gut metagenome]